MSSNYFPGNPILMEAEFKNKETGVHEDPDTVTLYITNDDNGERTTVLEADLTNDSVGFWSYVFTVPLDTGPYVGCYGFYGENSNGDPYAYNEKRFRIKETCAAPT